MLLDLTRAFEVITLSDERVIALFHHFFLQFRHIVEIDQKAQSTTTSRPPVPCILQILTTFNLYSGRPRVDLSVNNKQKVRQAIVKISRGGGGGAGNTMRYQNYSNVAKWKVKIGQWLKDATSRYAEKPNRRLC